ncbi:hypothetical protein COHA_005815 [Chlorella ohadii]|uniref:Uncharacterized protein n=1 Tax=Chlorella ohadii TaxID=2649997 RepID=A0AAD5H1I7_9CHLO|nr:hypothetical protein COHA_005815 [Chlorella ohadii]
MQVADQGPAVWQSVHCRKRSAPYLRRTVAPEGDAEQQEPARRPPTAQQLAALLGRQRAHLRRLTLAENAGHWDVPAEPMTAVLAAAEPMAAVLAAATGDGSGLTDLTLVISEQLPDFVMETLPGSAAQLTSLVLRPLRGHIPFLRFAQFDGRLAQLRSLSLTGRFQTGEAAEQLSQLTALTRLRLASAQPGQPDVSLALLACPGGLARLELFGVSVELLNVLHLAHMRWNPFPGFGPTDEQDHLIQQVHNLGLLPSPEELAELESAAALAPPPAPGLLWPPAEGSIGALLLPRWQQLEHLRLHKCELDDSVFLALPRLKQLTMLQLSAIVRTERAVAAVQECSRLQELVLGRLSTMPRDAYQLPAPTPGALPQLTRLRLSGCEGLSRVDEAWCSLPNLLSFEVESCDDLTCPSLAGLTRVEQLVFSHQRLEHLPDSITGLTTLTRLAVTACSLEQLRPGPYLRGLRELNLFANALRDVPEALAHPHWGSTALHLLDMSSNHSHFLSDADVAVLGQLSVLTSLRLGRQEFDASDAHPAGPLAALRVALPDCQINA